MSCFYHSDRDAVATCPQCGKYLCHDCASVTTDGICYNCAIAANEEVKNIFKAETITFVILLIGVIVSFCLIGNSNKDYLTIGWIVLIICGVIPAWKFLTRVADAILGNRVYVGAVWFGVIIFKAVLSLFVSIFMPFWYGIKFFINLNRYLKVKKNMKLLEEHYNSIR